MRNELQGRGAVDSAERGDPLVPPDRFTVRKITKGALARIAGSDALVRLESAVPGDCPLEVAEDLVRRHRIPGRVYSGLLLADPVALRRAWAELKGAAHA